MITQIVASWEDVRDSVLLLTEAIEPQVTAQATLSRQLPIPREVVVKLLRAKATSRTIQVVDIEADMELGLTSGLRLFRLRSYLPVEFLHGTPVEGLCVERLTNDLLEDSPLLFHCLHGEKLSLRWSTILALLSLVEGAVLLEQELSVCNSVCNRLLC